jgi:hypothetical protein
MLDVGGGDQLDIGRATCAHRPSAEASIIPLPPSVQELPPSPTTIRRAPSLHRGRDQLSDSLLCAASAVCDRRRTAEQRQPAGLRALDVGRARTVVVETQSASTSAANGPLTRMRAPLADASGEHVDESGSSVGLRGERQSSPGGPAPPSAMASAACTAVRLSP